MHPGEPAGVGRAQRVVLDLGDQRRGLLQRRDPALDGVEVVAGQRRLQHELDQRGAAGDQVADGGVPVLLPQLAGVAALGLHRDERLRDEALVLLERLHRGGLARRVAVEGVDDLAAELVLVHQQPAQHADVLGAERRAAGGDGGGDAGEVAGHDVGVALDDDGLVPLGDVALGPLDAVEHGALLVQRRLGGVEVLRARVVVHELAGAEADDVAGEVADRPDQPAVEAVDQRAARGLLGQPAGDQLGLGEAVAAQVPGERVPAARGVAAAEVERRPAGRSRARRGTGGRVRRRACPAARRRSPRRRCWPRPAGPAGRSGRGRGRPVGRPPSSS